MLSPEENFQPLSNDALKLAVLAETRALDAVAKLQEFPRIINRILNYPKFLSSITKANSPINVIAATSNGKRIISVARMAPTIRELMCTAHVAACSTLLEGRSFAIRELVSDGVSQAISAYVTGPTAADSIKAHDLMKRLLYMDAVRTIQLLRVFGLVTRHSGDMRQLALGCATGLKDVQYAHTMPAISMSSCGDDESLSFSTKQSPVADIIVSDLDPRHRALYDQYNKDPSSPVSGYVADTFELLELLASRNIRKRNLITAFRIEPAMIPDTREFLRRLNPLIEDNCDLVLSVGIGNSAEAFSKRIDLIADLFEILYESGHHPALFKLHLDGTILEQARSLQFGSGAASSHEILYCSLSPDKINRAYGL